jgi:hypothetical protein
MVWLHQTTEYVENEDGDGDMACVASTQQCAGAMIFLLKQNRPNVAMRLACAIGDLDLDVLDLEAPVADSVEAFVRHHGG